MPDPKPETGTPETPAPQDPPVEPADPADGRLPDDHPLVKAYAATKSDLADVRAKLKQFEDSQKSEAERLADEQAAAIARATAAEAEAARLRSAVKHGLSDEDLDLLGDGTPEEIEARAERLAKRLDAQRGPRKPTPDPSQGNRATAEATDKDTLARGVFGLG